MQLLAVNNELAYNEALIEEREQGITEIAQQIGEVSEIFQDLAVLVNDQVKLWPRLPACTLCRMGMFCCAVIRLCEDTKILMFTEPRVGLSCSQLVQC